MQNPKSSWLSLIEPVALFPELLARNSPLKIKLFFLKRRVKELSLLPHALVLEPWRLRQKDGLEFKARLGT